ncbi:DUF262 domain-containing protein [Actinobacillus pleuropneumoniae]|uniref:DUF262 domain-containing protein n=1 Tax=Actinobacillus pleuropneumoniae TaxID=715 RepID=UPI003F7B6F38
MFDYNNVLALDVENHKENYREFDNRIVTEQARYPLSNITDIFEKHVLNPNYQRNEVWKDDRKSKLIESFMMNIPIPPVFLYEVQYAKYEVVDGRQRISTLQAFYKDLFSLQGMEIFEELNGCTYSTLPTEFKDRLNRRFLSAIILLKESTNTPERELELKQFIFERLNTGGESLEAQEIRSALYSENKFNHLLKELSENKILNKLFPFSEKDKKRMADRELVLRFFAYKSAHALKLSLSTKEVLDKYMALSSRFNDGDIFKLRELFHNTIDFVNNKFGDKAFFNGKSKPEKMLYDAIMIASAICVENNINIDKNIVSLKEEVVKENIKKFNGKYTSLSNVRTRIDLILNLFN